MFTVPTGLSLFAKSERVYPRLSTLNVSTFFFRSFCEVLNFSMVLVMLHPVSYDRKLTFQEIEIHAALFRENKVGPSLWHSLKMMSFSLVGGLYPRKSRIQELSVICTKVATGKQG